MRIISINVNGIRSAARKGFFEWLSGQDADVVCLQETRAHEHQIPDEIFRPSGYHCYYLEAERKGYSGVALYSRRRPERIIRGFGSPEFDREARYVEAVFPGLSVASLYMPSGPRASCARRRSIDSWMNSRTSCGVCGGARAST
jgi:exodeoxyribonuclease III